MFAERSYFEPGVLFVYLLAFDKQKSIFTLVANNKTDSKQLSQITKETQSHAHTHKNTPHTQWRRMDWHRHRVKHTHMQVKTHAQADTGATNTRALQRRAQRYKIGHQDTTDTRTTQLHTHTIWF